MNKHWVMNFRASGEKEWGWGWQEICVVIPGADNKEW